MDYKKRFIEAYMEAQLKDASETMKWASNKMNSYADEFSTVINGKSMKDMFMNGHSSAGGGNGVFTLYNQIGDHFWNLIQFISEKVPENKIVYVMMHEESNDLGEIKPKTIGKLLDEKVCIEGMFTVVLRCIAEGNNHLFVTQAADGAVSKSPIGMFDDLTIDNDILLVEKAIREYYELGGKKEDAETK